MTNHIVVQATATDGRTVLWERHPTHPDGECFIVADGTAVTVARTPRVAQLIADGVVVEIPAAVPTAPARRHAAT